MTPSTKSKIIFANYVNGKPLSKYALQHNEFLRNYHPRFYTQLLALGKLISWLTEIDNIAKSRFDFAEKFNIPFHEAEQSLFTEVIYNLK